MPSGPTLVVRVPSAAREEIHALLYESLVLNSWRWSQDRPGLALVNLPSIPKAVRMLRTRVDLGRDDRLLRDLPSAAMPDGMDAQYPPWRPSYAQAAEDVPMKRVRDPKFHECLAFQAPRDEDFLIELEESIPPAAKHWKPALRAWLVDDEWRDAAIGALDRHFAPYWDPMMLRDCGMKELEVPSDTTFPVRIVRREHFAALGVTPTSTAAEIKEALSVAKHRYYAGEIQEAAYDTARDAFERIVRHLTEFRDHR